MAIATLDQYMAATKFNASWFKSTARTTLAAMPYSLMELAGVPTGTMPVGNATAGVVRTDATAGFPSLPSFGSALGYITRIEASATVAMRIRLFDQVFSAGTFNANTNGTITLTSQPSFTGRLPGNNYIGTELWYEANAAITTNQSLAVTYVDQSGNLGHTTGTVAFGVAPAIGRMFRLPLAAGDTGIQTINTVVGTVSTAGTFNLHIMRPLCSIRLPIANHCEVLDFLRTGMPQIFDTSALFPVIYADSTSSGIVEMNIEVAYA